MRTLLTVICVVAFAGAIGAFRQAIRQIPSFRYEPASVVSAVDAVYPLQSVGSGGVFLRSVECGAASLRCGQGGSHEMGNTSQAT